MKKRFSAELAYLSGIVLLALGTAFMERADFGMSMVVAPAYILHLKLSRSFAWFSFGMSEYLLQGVLILVISFIMRRFKKGYLFSFITAVVYGLILDGCIALVSPLPLGGIAGRCVWYVLGFLVCALAVALIFHTYIAPEAYELFVRELVEKTGADTGRVKTIYDCTSCIIGILLSFACFGFGHFEGVKLGTVLCALVNGWTIGKVSGFLEKKLEFFDALPLRRYFE